MNNYLSRLNSTERRFVVGVALLFFVVINLVWVRPHFSDWSKYQTRLAAAREKQKKCDDTFQKAASLKPELDKMENATSAVPQEDQAIDFLRTIQNQAAKSQVVFSGSQRPSTRTNQFFIEQAQTITLSAGEQQLIGFLYDLGESSSLVRARDLSLRTDPARQLLLANITLVASYQKKSAVKTPATPPATATNAPKTSAPAIRPAAPAIKPATVQTSTPPGMPAPGVKPSAVNTSLPPAQSIVIPAKPKTK